MKKFNILIVSDDIDFCEKINDQFKDSKDCISYYEMDKIPFNELTKYEIVILDFYFIKNSKDTCSLILSILSKDTTILILAIRLQGSVQDFINVIKAGAYNYISGKCTVTDLEKGIQDLKNVYWYRMWKKNNES